MLKFVQSSRDSQLDLVGSSWLASHQKLHTCQACWEVEASCQPEHYRTKSPDYHSVSSRLELAAQSSHEAKPPASFVLKNWLFAFQTHTSINTPYTHEILRASRENIERETLEKNKIDSSTIFKQRLFKFLYSHPLHCYILERFITKIFSHHTHIYKKAFWWFGKQLGRTNSHWLMLWFIVESGKLKKK